MNATTLFSTAVLFAASIFTLAGCATTGSSTQAQLDPKDADAVVNVSGISCPQCANSIKLIMDDTEGIDQSRVDMGTGRVFIDFTPGSTLTNAQIEQLIKDAGFTPGDIQQLKKETP